MPRPHTHTEKHHRGESFPASDLKSNPERLDSVGQCCMPGRTLGGKKSDSRMTLVNSGQDQFCGWKTRMSLCDRARTARKGQSSLTTLGLSDSVTLSCYVKHRGLR
ncbi:hypothetical protein RRG08_013573 [Elysia crispata]|uniref:Uncharacterized protein n=1 Tax=Elysia crispata TaxID=231223 RepID=A0AAE0Y0F5_9GAST|nr:hypothetical protein RRG08_013573 [Elysia crispata]